jgi:hypothetical protein
MAFTALGSQVLTGGGDTLDVTGLENKPVLHIEGIIRGANTRILVTFNGDTGANYSYKYNGNQAGASSSVNANYINPTFDTAPTVKFLVMDIINYDGQEKIGIGKYTDIGSAGVSNAPDEMQFVFKWTGSDVIDQVTFTNDDSGDYGATSSLSVFGSA